MKNFKNFWRDTHHELLIEKTFRKSSKIIHVIDYPMFSLFYNKNILTKYPKDIVDQEIKKTIIDGTTERIFKSAKKQITALGFSSQHANVVLNMIPNPENTIITGRAHSKTRHIEIQLTHFFRAIKRPVVKTIVHEWAHLWMLNKGNAFKEAVEQLYNNIIRKHIKEKNSSDIIDDNKQKISDELKEILNYNSDDYSSMLDTFSDILINLLNIPFGTVIMDDLELFYKAIDEISKYSEDFKNILNDFIKHNNPDIFLNKIITILKNIAEILNLKITSTSFNQDGAEELQKLVKWNRAYGLTNSDEFWATAVDGFFNLQFNYKREIVRLMMNNN
jgi:hypothetical protein